MRLPFESFRQVLPSHIVGTAYGLWLAERAAENLGTFRVPPWVATPLEWWTGDDDDDALLDHLKPLVGREVIFRWAGTSEAFSPEAARGANSSCNNPRIFLTADALGPVREWVRAGILAGGGRRCVIAQSWEQRPGGFYFICHVRAGRVFIELDLTEGAVTYYWGDPNAEPLISSATAGGVAAGSDMAGVVDRIFALAGALRQQIDLDLDFEGALLDDDIVVCQLRDIPPDFRFDAAASHIPEGLPILFRTSLVVGAFHVRARIVALDSSVPLKGPLIIATPQALGVNLGSPDLANVSCLWSRRDLQARLLENEPTVFLHRSDRASTLQHGPRFLPPPGILRNAFNVVYLPSCAPGPSLQDGEWIVASDGYGAVCLKDIVCA